MLGLCMSETFKKQYIWGLKKWFFIQCHHTLNEHSSTPPPADGPCVIYWHVLSTGAFSPCKIMPNICEYVTLLLVQLWTKPLLSHFCFSYPDWKTEQQPLIAFNSMTYFVLHITLMISMHESIQCICTYKYIKHTLWCIIYVHVYMHVTSSFIHIIYKILCMFLIYFERPAWVSNCLLLRQKEDWKLIADVRNYLSLH